MVILTLQEHEASEHEARAATLALMFPPRDFLHVREKLTMVILSLQEQEARAATLALVDDWAGQVMEAHIGSEFFGLRSMAEFITAYRTRCSGMGSTVVLGSPLARELNIMMNDRVEFWVEHSSRFPPRLQIKTAPNFTKPFS